MIKCTIPSNYDCIDCEHSYIDNLFYEVQCKLKNHIAEFDIDSEEKYVCEDFKNEKDNAR